MKLTLTEKREEVPGIFSFFFKPEEEIKWNPGQFVHAVLHHEPTDDRGSDRWFTISAAPAENILRITTRFAKDKSSSFKKELFSLEEGKEIEITGVEGDFTITDPQKEYVFIAGGIGITPFRSILKQLDFEKKPIKVTLLYANRDQNIVYKDELEEISKNNHDFKIYYIFAPEHIDEEKIKQFVPNLANALFYVSGPEPMVDSLNQVLKTLGIPDERIKGDWFPGYPIE